MADEFVVKNGVIVKTGTLTIGDPSTTGYALPSTDGTTGQALVTDGAGSVTFGTVSGSGGGTEERFQINYNASGDITSITNQTSGVSSVVIVNPAGIIDIQFTGHSNPPTSIIAYGYDEPNNQYLIQTLIDASWSNRLISNGTGAFGSFSSETMTLTASKANTDAVSSFGVGTHAYLVFMFGD